MKVPLIDTARAAPAASCSLCGSLRFERLWEKDGFDYIRCSDCRVVRVNPQLNEKNVQEIYSSSHRYRSRDRILDRAYPYYRLSLLKKLEAYRQDGHLLDVGCSRGYFIASAQRQSWDSCGTDIASDDVAHARDILKQNALFGDLRTLSFPDEYFDVVTLFDTLEHLREPGATLKEINRILRKGGLLYVETPNFDSLPKMIWGRGWSVFFPWHFYYFTPQSLRAAVESRGFLARSLFAWGVLPFGRGDAVARLENEPGKSDPIRDDRVPVDTRSSGEFSARLLLSMYTWARSAERALFAGCRRCAAHVGTKLELWAEKRS